MAKYQSYAEYKDSGLEWLGEIPSHWKVKKLKYLGEAIIGLTYSPDDVVDESEGTLVLRSSNIQNKKLAFEDNVYVRKEIPEKLRTQKNDILICARNGSRALIGKNALIDESAEGVSFGAFMSIFRSEYNSYLSKVFNSALFEYQSGTFLTATINQLTTGNLNSFEVPLPPLTERNQISNFLDYETRKIDHLIEKQQQLIELLKEKRQAVISHAVTKGLDPNVPMKDSGVEWLGEVPEHWDVRQLRYLGSCQNGINIGAEYFGSGSPFISYGDVYRNTALPENFEGLVQSSENDKKIYSVIRGDVLFTRTSETIEEIGFSSTCLRDVKNATFAGFLIRFRPNENILYPEYSKFLFRNQLLRAFFVKEMNLVTRASLSQELLKKLPVVLPSDEEQKNIAEFLTKKDGNFEQLIINANKTINLLKERRTALISAAVTGKIDVRHWQAPMVAEAHTELSA